MVRIEWSIDIEFGFGEESRIEKGETLNMIPMGVANEQMQAQRSPPTP
jgi:hypothetical protein